jgi:DNA-directed RNA polymerase specialized sigma24 family protein
VNTTPRIVCAEADRQLVQASDAAMQLRGMTKQLLRDIQELSPPEAAVRLGISIDALKSRLHRARVNLRDHVLRRAQRAESGSRPR